MRDDDGIGYPLARELDHTLDYGTPDDRGFYVDREERTVTAWGYMESGKSAIFWMDDPEMPRRVREFCEAFEVDVDIDFEAYEEQALAEEEEHDLMLKRALKGCMEWKAVVLREKERLLRIERDTKLGLSTPEEKRLSVERDIRHGLLTRQEAEEEKLLQSMRWPSG